VEIMPTIRRLTLLGASVLAAASCTRGPVAEPPASSTSADRVARIEAALLPSVIIEGRELEAPSLEERMSHYGVPGVSVAMIDGGRIDWVRTYGAADEDGRPVTPTTRFQAASISKPVAAMAALALVDRGLLDLDADVNESLTSWKVPANDFTEKAPVSLRGLLSHTAGLTVHGFPGYGPDEKVPGTIGVLDGEGNTDPVRVKAQPGTAFSYSGGGYTVAQQVVEDVTGVSFPQAMRTLVLEPLGMEHSTYRQPLPAELRDEAATGYRPNGTPVEGRFHTYPEMAAAGLWTTPSDLALFLISLQRARQTGQHPVLSADTADEMLTPVLEDYGLGLGIPDGQRFGHGGSNEGFRCTMTALLDGDQGVVIMTNSDRGSALAQEILLSVAREYGWSGPEPERKTVIQLSDEQLAAITGAYAGKPGDVRLVHQGDHFTLHPWWDEDLAMELLPESESTLFDLSGNLTVGIVRGDDGSVSALEAFGAVFEKK
jgi:CubicO group peptidase (beta-lactamase class C family)